MNDDEDLLVEFDWTEEDIIELQSDCEAAQRIAAFEEMLYADDFDVWKYLRMLEIKEMEEDPAWCPPGTS